MLSLVLNAVASVLVTAIAVHAVILHVRLGRLRAALSEMGSVLPEFDASVNRIAAMADGFTVKVSAELEGIETRLQAARRLSVELASASREAEEAAIELGRALRQTKRSEPVRASALPREMVEPKGFAERAGLPPVQMPSDNSADPPPAEDRAPAPTPDMALPQAGDTAATESASDDPEQSQPNRSRLRQRRFPKVDRTTRPNKDPELAVEHANAEPAATPRRRTQAVAA